MKYKNYKIIIKRLTKILICISLIAGVFGLLDYMYEDVNEWTRSMLHGFYSEKEIDTVFMGSSHVYTGVAPAVVDSYLNCNSFNLATGGQTLFESFENLKEANRLHEIKTAYVEMYYVFSTCGYGEANQSNTSNAANWRYWKLSTHKIECFLHMPSTDKKLEALFPFVRYRDHISDTDWIQRNITIKGSDNYKKYTYHEESSDGNGYNEYAPQNKGFNITTRRYPLDNKLLVSEIKDDEMHLSDNTRNILSGMKELCDKNGIKLVLFTTPIYVEETGSVYYDSFNRDVNKWADENGVEFYDFNLCNSEILPIQSREYFIDTHHLNTYGAAVFDEVMCKVFKMGKDNSSKYFYDSFEEKMMEESEKTYGMCFIPNEDSDSGDEGILKIVASKPEKMEYKVWFEGTEGESEYKLLQDWDSNTELRADLNNKGCYYLEWKYVDSDSTEEKLSFTVE